MPRISLGTRRRAAAVLGAAAAFRCAVAGPAAAADPLAVGVLLPGSRSDKGWMESAYDGSSPRRRSTATRSRCS